MTKNAPAKPAEDLCSTGRKGAQRGARNHQWKGGRVLASNGYVLCKVPRSHHLADTRGYAYEHRLVAEQKAGRRLRDGEQVHHINGDKTDNRPSNIEITESLAHHRVSHRRSDRGRQLPGEPNPIVTCACGCGQTFLKYHRCRPRRFVSGHNLRVDQREVAA